ncbi:MAG: type II secretion system F family protein [Geminicoccaceae bacterium]
MAVWTYRAAASDGRIVEGRLEANDRSEALNRLQSKNGIIFHLAEAGDGSAPPQGGTKLSRPELITLSEELGALLEAQLPLDEALSTLIASTRRQSARRALIQVSEAIAGGSTLSDAMAGAVKNLPGAAAGLIRAGELEGDLGSAFARLASLLHRQRNLQKSIGGALIYPAILLAMTVASLAMILLAVVPNLEPLFLGAGDAMPLSASVLLSSSAFLREQGALLCLVLAMVVGTGMTFARRPEARTFLERRLLALPVVGDLIRAMEASMALRLVSALISSGAPLPDALDRAAGAMGTRAFATGLAAISNDLRQGGVLPTLVAKERVFPPAAARMAAVGVRTGRLAPMLLAAAETIERDGDGLAKKITTVLPPALTLAMGGLIAAVVLSILTAIMSVNELAI